MSLRILVDEDSQARRLVRRLREAGHDLSTVNEAHLAGATDAAVLASARREARVVLTANARDFRALHQSGAEHAGILAVCQDDNPAKDMSGDEIVRSIGNLEASGLPIAGEFHVLNAWRW